MSPPPPSPLEPVGQGVPGLTEEVRQCLGVLPHFFGLAPEQPEVTRNLWGFAKFAYLDNPLPSLFKERLFVYLSRFRDVRYCLARHVGFLAGLGRPAGDEHCPPQTVAEIVRLLRRPLPRGQELESTLALGASAAAPLAELPAPESPLEAALVAWASHVFLQTPEADRCLAALQRLLGAARSEHLSVLLAFIHTAHSWSKTHPELRLENDIEHLLAMHAPLAACVDRDSETSADGTNRQLLDELVTLRQEHAGHADLQRLQHRQAFLLKLSDALRPLADPAAVKQEAARLLRAALGVDRVCYLETALEDEDVVFATAEDAARGVMRLTGLSFRFSDFDQNLLPRLRQGEMIVYDDIDACRSLSPEQRAAYAAIQTRAYIYVALVKDGRVIAGLMVGRITPHAWTSLEIERLQETAERTWAVVARARAAEALRESEGHLRAALEAGRMAYWTWDPATDTLRTSHTMAALFGLNAGTTLQNSRKGFDVLHPDDHARHEAIIASAIDRARGWHREFRIIRPRDGKLAWLEERAEPLPGDGRAGHRFTGLVWDITERKEADRALHESEARLAAVFEALPMGVGVVDPDGRVMLSNREMRRFLPTNKSPSHDDENAWRWIAHHFDGRRVVRDDFPTARALRGEHVTPGLEMLFIQDDEVQLWTRVASVPLLDLEGRVTGAFFVVTDIDTLKRAEETIQDSESRLRGVANIVPDLLWHSEPDGATFWFNDRWIAYTGQTFAKAMGWGWAEAVHPDDREAAVRRYREAVETHRAVQHEYRIRRATGEYRWFLVRAEPLRGPDGRLVRMYGAATDIHDMKTAEARLQEADRRKNHFLATLGHELRNPLAAIHAGLQLLASPKAKPESKERALPVALEQTAHMERLVDDLLDVTRIVQGRVTLRKNPMVLQDALRQAVEMCRPQAEQGKFAITVDVPDQPLRLMGDGVRLAQVFVNILGNALKYSGTSRRIEISAAREERTIVVRIRDYGQGISADLLPRIFDPFVQAKPGLTLEAGMGMGLAVARELVRLHGGTIEAFSAGVNQGSQFVVQLPAMPGPP